MKNVFKYLYLLAILLMASCGENPELRIAKPADLLNRNQMAEVLADMHVADAGLQLNHYSPDSIKRMNAGYADFILKKHNVSQKQFESSFDYYLSIPMEMDSVYLVLVDVLSMRESRSRGMQTEPVSVSPVQ